MLKFVVSGDYPVVVESGIKCPTQLDSSFVSPLAVFLNGNGKMLHIINDKGAQTSKPSGSGAVPAWVCGNASAPVAVEFSHENGTCQIGDSVPCPTGPGNCAGNSCCPGGTTCPSADPKFQCCPNPGKSCVGPPGLPPPPGPKMKHCTIGVSTEEIPTKT